MLPALLLVTGLLVPVGGIVFDATTCGREKKCVSIPPGCFESSPESCEFVFSSQVTPDGKFVDIELFTKRASPKEQYVAVGFSADTAMGGEAVTSCITPPTEEPNVVLSYNEGQSNVRLADDVASLSDATLVYSRLQEDIIYCKTRQLSMQAHEKLPLFADQPFHLLFARGPVRNGNPGFHTAYQASEEKIVIAEKREVPKVDPPTSDEDQDDQVGDNETPKSTAPPPVIVPQPEQGSGPFGFTRPIRIWLLRFHGLFMLIGWYACASVAVFVARYSKPHLKAQKLFGLQLWFVLHKGLNLLGLVLIVGGTLLAFVAKDFRWLGPAPGNPEGYNTKPFAIHTLLGAIAVALGVLQPFGSLLRCEPTSAQRPVFNWVHRITGIVAIILSLIATVIAAFSFKIFGPDKTLPIIVSLAYVAFAVLVITFVELLPLCQRSHESHSLELQQRNKSVRVTIEQPPLQRSSGVLQSMKAMNLGALALFASGSAAFSVLLSLLFFF